MTRTIFAMFFTILLTIGFAQQPLSLNMEEAVKIALQRNVPLQQSKNNLETSENQVKSAYGGLLPTLSASSGFSWALSEDEGGVITVGGISFPVPKTSAQSRSYSASVSSGLTLFDGLSNFATIGQSKSNYESDRYRLERLKQDIVFQTQTKYFGVLKSLRLLAVQEENLKWNNKSLETITERNRVGQITLADVYQQQVNFGNSELLVIQARNNYENAKNDLISFLSLDVAKDYVLIDADALATIDTVEYKKLEREFTDFEKLIETAFENRVDYFARQLDLQSYDYAITIARSGHLPRLTGSLSASIRANSFSSLTSLDSRTYIAGLNLSIPIFNGWLTSNRVQFAEVNYKNAELGISELERTIKVNLKKASLDLQAAKKKLDVNNKNVIAAKENLRINEEKYSLGSGTLLNLLIANSQFTQAQGELINSTFDYLLIRKQMEYYLGILEYKSFDVKE
ncbi:MAG: TolC family protein [Bacteroidetes bacterium]|nr:TolC family protein [Bacteroidota bacterium]